MRVRALQPLKDYSTGLEYKAGDSLELADDNATAFLIESGCVIAQEDAEPPAKDEAEAPKSSKKGVKKTSK